MDIVQSWKKALNESETEYKDFLIINPYKHLSLVIKLKYMVIEFKREINPNTKSYEVIPIIGYIKCY
jgi:hypothetical protein